MSIHIRSTLAMICIVPPGVDNELPGNEIGDGYKACCNEAVIYHLRMTGGDHSFRSGRKGRVPESINSNMK